jgi:hypothetical protein
MADEIIDPDGIDDSTTRSVVNEYANMDVTTLQNVAKFTSQVGADLLRHQLARPIVQLDCSSRLIYSITDHPSLRGLHCFGGNDGPTRWCDGTIRGTRQYNASRVW